MANTKRKSHKEQFMENFEFPNNNEPAAISGAELLDEVAALIRKYLVCDDHQLTLLTLWTAFTQCHEPFSAAPYLDIRSPEFHCGKTLCLDLLHFLTEATVFTGTAPRLLIENLLAGRRFDDLRRNTPFTILLDNCHHTFSSSERQPIIALFNSGAEGMGTFLWGDERYCVFGPKAFAGNAPLPRSLASRCIPIALRRPKPSEKYTRFQWDVAWPAARIIRQRLFQWLQDNSLSFDNVAQTELPNLPPTLSPGQRKCSEPLLHIADLVGGSWPARARVALSSVFNLEEASTNTQLLFDIRNIFHEKNNPEYLATSDLLSELSAMDTRPWSAWNSKSGRRIGSLLRPFGVAPTHLNRSEGQFRGYLIASFQEAWERYLPPASAGTDPLPTPPDGNGGPDGTQITSVLPSVTTISAIDAGSDT
jgi:hypothetical protein